jgi:hypothetical protein
MSKVTYELIHGDQPLYSIYLMLQIADQSQQFSEGIARDVLVKIKDHYVLTDFLVIDMGDEQNPPIVLGVGDSHRGLQKNRGKPTFSR